MLNPEPVLNERVKFPAGSIAGINFHHAALPFHGDDALLKRRKKLSRIGNTLHEEVRRRVIVREDFDRADAQYFVPEGLVELEVFHVPELEGIDGGGEPAALEIDAIVRHAIAGSLDDDH